MKKQTTEEVIYGLNSALAVFKNRPSSIVRCYLESSVKQRFSEQLRILAKQKRAYHLIEKAELSKLTGTPHHEGISLLVKKRPILRPAQAFSKLGDTVLIVGLSAVQNPHNIGAIARSAAHFGASGIILPDRFHLPAISYRIAEGGLEKMIIANGTNDEILELKASGFKLVAANPHHGTPLNKAKFPKKMILILGSEGEGLDKNFEKECDLLVNIPGCGDIESLNVSAAASILLYKATN